MESLTPIIESLNDGNNMCSYDEESSLVEASQSSQFKKKKAGWLI